MNIMNKELIELRANVLKKLAERHRTEQTIERYKQVTTDFSDFLSFFNKPISEESAAEFLEAKQAKGLDKNSLRTYYFALKGIIAISKNSSTKMVNIPFALEKTKFREPKYFSWDNIFFMLQKSFGNKRNNAFIRLLVATLARRNEILSLEKRDFTTEVVEFQQPDGSFEQKLGYFVNIREEISKSDSRKIIIDGITYRQIEAIADNLEQNDRIFNFSLRYSNMILEQYRPDDIDGGIHAIRHGVARYIAGNLKTRADEDVLKYYMGHKNPSRFITDRYTTLSPVKLFKWYVEYHPLMRIGEIR